MKRRKRRKKIGGRFSPIGGSLHPLLTPKFGTGRSLICGPSLEKKSVRKKEGFSRKIR
jgi:hypothetical protein